jgi:hypothetical protein
LVRRLVDGQGRRRERVLLEHRCLLPVCRLLAQLVRLVLWY